MSYNSWNQTLITSQVDGSALSNTTTATSILPGAAKFTLPANVLQIGTKLILRAHGRISTVVTTPGNMTFDIRAGASTVIWNGAATALNVSAQTNATWDLEVNMIVRAIGASTTANLIGVGKWTSRAALNAPAVGTTTGVGVVLLPDTAPAVGSGFDSTAANVIDLFSTWSVANASNSITCHMAELVLCN